MNDLHRKLMEEFRKDLEKSKYHRTIWMLISAILVVGLLFIAFSWNYFKQLHSPTAWWTLGIIGSAIVIKWWISTFILIKRIITHQSLMIDILSEITIDIREIKTEVGDLYKKGLIQD